MYIYFAFPVPPLLPIHYSLYPIPPRWDCLLPFILITFSPIAYSPSPPTPTSPVASSMNATIKIQSEHCVYLQWHRRSVELWENAIKAHQAK